MSRIVALLSILVTLAACGVGGWATARQSLAQFVVPDATDVQVAVLGWGEWQISYDAPGSPAIWYVVVAQQLEAQHWSSPDRVGYGALARTYSRTSSYGFGELWEWAFLTIDTHRPRGVRIRVRQQVAMPWR